ncbi:hypothetical protein ACH5RR_030879 [Cinchona calisaya]|uniref:Morc S5 domain-containing protein n=1 Tax=Cinchona calisaya TaxID=153742 RepID=A0ABD2YX16_9GENT
MKEDVLEVKQEVLEPTELSQQKNNNDVAIANHNANCSTNTNNVIDISSSSSSSDDGGSLFGWDTDSDFSDVENTSPRKKQRKFTEDILPVGFLDPLRPEERLAMQQTACMIPNDQLQHRNNNNNNINVNVKPLSSIYPKPVKEEEKEPLAVMLVEEEKINNAATVDPIVINKRNTSACVKQFWKAGDYEDSDGSFSASETVGMDHVRVHPKFLHSNATSHKWALGAFAELLDNALDEVCNGATYVHMDMLMNGKDPMLLVEDNGGGMTPDRIRQCMSLGYSAKSKLANTIGQYGNGFKTSTMRLGADVIVFSRCQGKDGRSATQSIGMLSYTFLRGTGKEDIVVPMIDYEKRGNAWHVMIRSTFDDWKRNLETVMQWSPYVSEEDLLLQFDYMKDQGTRIIIYNLWQDDQGSAELDFESDKHDIQIRGVNRDEKKIAMAKNFPNLTHYLTYRHSLRNYAAILYLRIPPGFRIILRGKDVEHYNTINSLRYSKEITYRPQAFPDDAPKDPNMRALLTIGFIKDADYHVDVQGFNVYHKNRLIKPFWRVWNAAGSDGRGVIGVLEANFVEPAHDKQSFERTIAFSRLENRLVTIQKEFWSTNCHMVGYAKRRDKNSVSHAAKAKQLHSTSNSKAQVPSHARANISSNVGENEIGTALPERRARNEALSFYGKTEPEFVSDQKTDKIARHSFEKTAKTSRDELASVTPDSELVVKLKEENCDLKASLEDVLQNLRCEKDRNKSLENKIEEMEQRLKEMDKERQHLINVSEEESSKRDLTEEALRNKAMVASDVIEQLRNKINLLERRMAFLSRKRDN